jgi:homoserine O-acetyltransferase
VVALGGISSGRHISGAGGWWSEVIADGAGVDLHGLGAIGLDFAPLGDQRVRITPSDQARLLAHALDAIGVARLHAIVGASYGAMVGMAFAAQAPERLDRLCVISAAGQATAQALAWRGVQRRIVEFGLAQGLGGEGLSLARQLAMITYRSADELEQRFGAGVDADGRGEVDRYLLARGESYAGSVAPRRWLSLSEAIDRFSVDPGSIQTPTTVIACPTDQLVPYEQMKRFANALPRISGFHDLPSLYGHDAFLKEPQRLNALLRSALEGAANV